MLCNFAQLLHQGVANPAHSMCNKKGGGSAAAPDYRPMAAASERAAELGYQLGQQQLSENRRQYDADMAIAAPIISAQTGLMNQQISQGNDYYGYMKDTFRPIEQGLADEAQSGISRYNTNAAVRAAVEEEASRARSDVARAQSNALGQNARAMSAMGVNPNSGRFAAMNNSFGLQNAAMMAGAQTNARTKGVALDFARRMDVTGLGRNLTGASQGAYGLALNAGNSAVGNQNSTGQMYMGNMAAGNGTIMQGQGLNIQGLAGILNSQTSVYNAAQAAKAQSAGGIGSLIGTGIGAYAALS